MLSECRRLGYGVGESGDNNTTWESLTTGPATALPRGEQASSFYEGCNEVVPTN